MSWGIRAHGVKSKALFVFQEYPNQALLLLVTGALGLRILRSLLKPALPVLSTFKVIFCPFLPWCVITRQILLMTSYRFKDFWLWPLLFCLLGQLVGSWMAAGVLVIWLAIWYGDSGLLLTQHQRGDQRDWRSVRIFSLSYIQPSFISENYSHQSSTTNSINL